MLILGQQSKIFCGRSFTFKLKLGSKNIGKQNCCFMYELPYNITVLYIQYVLVSIIFTKSNFFQLTDLVQLADAKFSYIIPLYGCSQW